MDTTTPSENTRPIKTAKPADKRGWWWGTGRRKTAVARVRLRPITGQPKFTIVRPDDKTKTVEEFFTEARDRADCYAALKATGGEGRFEVVARVHGGGFMGQAQAIRLGVARALVAMDPALDPVLRDLGMLTRDAREVERKKYGQAGARRRFQFSKR
ncbi:MAG: 30S ribosomal protein S9 [Phycisphaerales bacterium]|jgi:small subunit ribosomal protein S9|nr:30S ribosomal protein S9 [Phycisphaerales bacterium]